MDIANLHKPALSNTSGQEVPIHVSDILMQFVCWLINESQNPLFNCD